MPLQAAMMNMRELVSLHTHTHTPLLTGLSSNVCGSLCLCTCLEHGQVHKTNTQRSGFMSRVLELHSAQQLSLI